MVYTTYHIQIAGCIIIFSYPIKKRVHPVKMHPLFYSFRGGIVWRKEKTFIIFACLKEYNERSVNIQIRLYCCFVACVVLLYGKSAAVYAMGIILGGCIRNNRICSSI